MFYLKRIWYLGNLNLGLAAYIYYLKKYKTNLPSFQTQSLIVAASGYVIREFVSFLYTSPSKCLQDKDLFLVVVGHIIYLLPAYFAKSSQLFTSKTNKIINYTSLALSIAGHLFNSYAEMQRKWWCDKKENKGKVYTEGLFSITRHPNYLGDILFITGWHILSRHWVPLILAPIQIYSFYNEYIPEIEGFMEKKHGTEWTDYVNKVKSSLDP
eukprot:UN09528